MMLKRLIFAIWGLAAIAAPFTAHAQLAKKIAVLDVPDSGSSVDARFLTEALYGAAAELPSPQFAVISREKLVEAIAKAGIDPVGCGGPCPLEAGRAAGADYVFAGQMRRFEKTLGVTVELHEVLSGRLIGAEQRTADSVEKLAVALKAGAVALAARIVVQPPLAPGPSSAESAVELKIDSEPSGAAVFVDGHETCRATPCRYRTYPGEYAIEMRLRDYRSHRERIQITGDRRVSFALEPLDYSYFGMNHLRHGGSLITVGLSPRDPDYRFISVIDGFGMADLSRYLDVGFGGSVFAFRKTLHGSSWSILGFGPLLRAGRLIVHSQIQLLSFRHRADGAQHPEGWRPGLTTRAMLPLVIRREARGWASLVPVPTAGIDVFMNRDLHHDETGFWIGLSWLSDFST